METGAMGEVTVKVRKPYTITKQRERWTEEEHNKFLDALKLYGRAWQRIEEHIGTKTAVQIRSHAQKFFSKLEKEALTKGKPLRLAHDIDVPPPRPKRKPRNPYPRKTVAGSLSICREGNQENPSKPVPSMSTNLQVLDTDSSAPGEESALSENLPRKEPSEDHRCSGVLNLFQEAPSASISSANKSSSNHYVCEVVPVVKEVDLALTKSFPIVGEDDRDKEFDGQKGSNVNKLDRFCINPQLKFTPEEKDIPKQPEEPGFSSKDDPQDTTNYSENVFVKFTDGISAKCMQTSNSDGQFPSSMTNLEGSHANANLFGNPPISAASEVYSNHAMPFNPLFTGQFPPFTQFQNNQDAYRSFVNFSPSFSSLIMSTLLHNPAVHAAACVAASLWPSQDADTSVDSASKTLEGGFPARHMNPSPSMTAIAAATVAAASAWWATHGLLPLFPPLHSVLSFTTTPATTHPSVDVTPHLQADREVQADALHTAAKDRHFVNPKNSDILETDPLKTLSPSLSSSSSSDLDVGQQSKSQGCPELKSPSANKLDNSSSTRFDDSDNRRSKKKVDRSSCGSNTPSSSDLETPIMLDKQDELKEEKETHFNSTLPGESSTRRSKISGNISESWKEVSEEGRLAFQALFMREILPQSFSSPHGKKKDATSPPVDLNWKACPAIDKNQVQGFTEERSRSNDNSGKGPLLCESGFGKLKTRRMGFKPYKRCSMEAKENRATGAGEEKGNKRIRVDGEMWSP